MTRSRRPQPSSDCLFFVNGIGDHFLALPAIRALVHMFPRRLTIIAHHETVPLFFTRSVLGRGLEQVIPIRTFTIGSMPEPVFDAESVARCAGPTKLFISLSPWLSPSLSQLIDRLQPEHTVGYFDCFKETVARLPGVHSVDWLFAVAQHIAKDQLPDVESFSAAPSLPSSATAFARHFREKMLSGSRLLIAHNESSASEKALDWKKFWAVLNEFLAANSEFTAVVLGTTPKPDSLVLPPRVLMPTNLSLARAFALVKAADLFIGIDSCFLHAADFFRVPGVGLYGPTAATEFGFRFGPHHHVQARSMAHLRTGRVATALQSLWDSTQLRIKYI